MSSTVSGAMPVRHGVLLTGVGGALGALLRWWLGTLVPTGDGFPWTTLAVNVSGRSLMSDSYVSGVLALLKTRPWAKGRLMFELTESAAVEDLAQADRRIQSLRAAGCEVCLDDFGAGAASLAYLQQLTLDLLKIDGRYIRDLQHGGREYKRSLKTCERREAVSVLPAFSGCNPSHALMKA